MRWVRMRWALGLTSSGQSYGIIAPPSSRKDGSYVWRDGVMPDLSRIPSFPEVLLDR